MPELTEPLAVKKSGEQVLAEIIEQKNSDGVINKERRDKFSEVIMIALASLYRAAEAGNVTCRNAVVEIESILLK